MSTPKIAFHGGLCCGIKTIHNLGYNTTNTADAIEKITRSSVISNADQYGHDVSSATNFYNENCPCEPYSARIERYIAYLDAVRPNGIIEIALADNEVEALDQVTIWEPSLLKWGFVQVTSCLNSNSGNRVFVFHRKTDKE